MLMNVLFMQSVAWEPVSRIPLSIGSWHPGEPLALQGDRELSLRSPGTGLCVCLFVTLHALCLSVCTLFLNHFRSLGMFTGGGINTLQVHAPVYRLTEVSLKMTVFIYIYTCRHRYVDMYIYIHIYMYTCIHIYT